MGNFDEQQFLRDYHANPQAAFRQLMDGYRNQIYLFCLRTVSRREDAEDIAQEVFIRAWKGLESFRGDSSLNTWIYRIAWNVCATFIEKKGRLPGMTSYEETSEEDGLSIPQIPTDEAGYGNFEDGQFLETIMHRIPEDYRLVVTMYYLQELSYEEICDVTGWTMSKVKVTLHRSKTKLRELALAEMRV